MFVASDESGPFVEFHIQETKDENIVTVSVLDCRGNEFACLRRLQRAWVLKFISSHLISSHLI
jgi:hypothetical protein